MNRSDQSSSPQILVIDDEPVSRLMTCAGLQQAGYCVTDVEDGEAALCHLASHHVDVVVLDLMMPGMDGFEVCRRIRASETDAYLPVLVMTGLDDDDSISHAYEAGATDFIGKPFSDVVMAQRVRFLIRTQEMQRALADSERRAHASADARSTFLANMSHEIRTPMNGVLGLLEQIDPQDLRSGDRERVLTARQSAEQLLSIINDVLDVSRIDSGELKLEQIPFVPGDVIEDVCGLLAPAATEKGIELRCQISETAFARYLGDPTRVRQIATNIVGNAVKFTATGRVEVSAHGTARALTFRVDDTGIGIAPDAGERLFREFDQLDASTTRRYGGAGLGLSIAKSLIDLMQGSVAVSSEPGKGSSFSVTLVLERRSPAERVASTALKSAWAGLPVWEAQMLADRLGEPVDQAHAQVLIVDEHHLSEVSGNARVIVVCDHGIDNLPETVTPVLRPIRRRQLTDVINHTTEERPEPSEGADVGIHVLLAEDNVVNQKVATGALRRLRYTYDLVDNGLEAVQAARSASYDLVLMDCQMPEMDGFQATREIRAFETEEKRPRVPIIALTANAMPADVERCLAAGMDDHIAKPFRIAALKQQIDRWTAHGD